VSRLAAQVLAGAWQDLTTGVDPTALSHKEDADGATDQAGTPSTPIVTRIEGGGAMVLPWWDAKEDPAALTGLYASPNPTPWVNEQDAGGRPIVGAYEGAVRTRGPVYQWGHEPSGGLNGDQAIGRILRFPANKPERYDANGVWNIDYADELAEAIASNGAGVVTESEYVRELLILPGVNG
jgi:hypothetical protein